MRVASPTEPDVVLVLADLPAKGAANSNATGNLPWGLAANSNATGHLRPRLAANSNGAGQLPRGRSANSNTSQLAIAADLARTR